ncbi:MAG: FKBP-type peptidyl-prolyl cis-trans isomerase [Erythrobacter sp.]
MAEVTRVPLQPIAKGSLTKLFLAVIVAVLIGGGLAWSAIPKGLSVDVVEAGEGDNPGPEDVVFVNYKGMLADSGEVFDETQDIPLPIEGIFPDGTPLRLSQMLPGFRDAAVQMQRGGKYEFYIPSDQAYGDAPPPGAPIPPGADLIFEVELIDFMTEEEFQQKFLALQQAFEAAGPEGGPPAGAGAPQPPAPGQ